MSEKKPLISFFASIIPGLGQLCNGENRRGLFLFLGVFFSLAISLLGMCGAFGFIFYDFTNFLLPLGLILWAGSAVDAFLRAGRMNRGEIAAPGANRLSMILLVAGALIAALVVFILCGLLLLFAAASYWDSYAEMHAERHLDIRVSAERNGSQIILTNGGGESSGLSSYGIQLNGQPQDQRLNATPGSSVAINGSNGEDHVVVRGCWITGACQTFLNTVV